MKTLADLCIDVILENEGGFQNNPNDPGNWVGGFKKGELVGTKYGIAAKYFPNEDIPNLTKEKAREIYKVEFWDRMNLYGIFEGEGVLQIFDMGVNAGKRRAIRMAQRLVGAEPDGIVGMETKNKINSHPNFTEEYKEARRGYYRYRAKATPTSAIFLNGWLKRVDKTKLIG